MKNKFWQLGTVAFLLIASCSCQRMYEEDKYEKDFDNESNKQKEKTICFSTAFSVQTEALRASESLVDYINTINWYDYQANFLKDQEIETGNMNEINISLEYGEHNLYFVAHNSANSYFEKNDHVFSTRKVTDTFWGYSELSVDENTSDVQTVNLKRVVGKIVVRLKDAIPSDAKLLRMVIENHCAYIDVKTGVGILDKCDKYSIQWTYKDSNIGNINTTYSVYSFIPSTEYKVNIKVDVLGNTNNVLFSKSIQDVPVKANQHTTLTGTLFNGEKEFSFSFSPEWDEGTDMPF